VHPYTCDGDQTQRIEYPDGLEPSDCSVIVQVAGVCVPPPSGVK